VYPGSFSGCAQGCISSLLTSAHVRLGGQALAAQHQSVQAHAFFDTVNWAQLAQKQIHPLWMPASLPGLTPNQIEEEEHASRTAQDGTSHEALLALFPEQMSALQWPQAVPSPASVMDMEAATGRMVHTPAGGWQDFDRLGDGATHDNSLPAASSPPAHAAAPMHSSHAAGPSSLPPHACGPSAAAASPSAAAASILGSCGDVLLSDAGLEGPRNFRRRSPLGVR